jgi:hypothetical protein
MMSALLPLRSGPENRQRCTKWPTKNSKGRIK